MFHDPIFLPLDKWQRLGDYVAADAALAAAIGVNPNPCTGIIGEDELLNGLGQLGLFPATDIVIACIVADAIDDAAA